MRQYELTHPNQLDPKPATFVLLHVPTGCWAAYPAMKNARTYATNLFRYIATGRRGPKYLRDFATNYNAHDTSQWRIRVYSEDRGEEQTLLPPDLCMQSRSGRPPRPEGSFGRTPLANLNAALGESRQRIVPFAECRHPHDPRDTWTLDRNPVPEANMRTTHFAFYLKLCMEADNNINPKPSLIARLWAGWLLRHPELQHHPTPQSIGDALDTPLMDYMQRIEFRGVWKQRR